MLSQDDIRKPYGASSLEVDSTVAGIGTDRRFYSPLTKVKQRPKSSSATTRRRKTLWNNRPKTPWKERPRSTWGKLPNINTSARPKTPTSTYKHKVKSTKLDFEEIVDGTKGISLIYQNASKNTSKNTK